MHTPKHYIYRRDGFIWRKNNLYEIERTSKTITITAWQSLPTSTDENGNVIPPAIAGVKKYDGKYYTKLGDTNVFTLESLKLKQWDDATMFCLACRENGYIDGFYNRTAFSMAARLRDWMYRGFTERTLLIMYVPYRTSNFDDCSFVSMMGDGGIILSDSIDFKEQTITGSAGLDYSKIYEFVPCIKFDVTDVTVSPDDKIEIPFTILDNVGELCNVPVNVYATSNGGYIPKTSFEVTTHGTLRFHALGLEVGEVVTLKLGYRWYVNDAQIQVRVI